MAGNIGMLDALVQLYLTTREQTSHYIHLSPFTAIPKAFHTADNALDLVPSRSVSFRRGGVTRAPQSRRVRHRSATIHFKRTREATLYSIRSVSAAAINQHGLLRNVHF